MFEKMKRDNVPHAPVSSDSEFLRRIYLDLTGRLAEPRVAAKFGRTPRDLTVLKGREHYAKAMVARSQAPVSRSSSATHAFRRSDPVPRPPRQEGPAGATFINHRQALKHVGTDSSDNMQWPTREAAKSERPSRVGRPLRFRFPNGSVA
jgi:hypothetical protein